MQKEEKKFKPEDLPSRTDMIEWYNKALELAEIVDRRYPVKGTFVWMPYGLRIMKALVREWDALFQKNDIEEVYFPLFVPIEYAQKNREWFDGFKDNLYYVSSLKEEEHFVLRSTGEPAMYPIFELWIKQGKLPIKVYQTVSSFRYEGKTTHSLIRDREITYWYEIHTVHKTKEECEKEAEKHVRMHDYLWRKVLCIPPIEARRPPYDVFPGAEYSIENFTILPDGRLLENGSVNNLGQAYAKKFNLEYIDEKGNKDYCWQVCTGNGGRYVVAALLLHGDERGLILPPRIAPVQIAIVPIYKKSNRDKIIEETNRASLFLSKHGIRSCIDEREEITVGEKFYLWEIKGAPIRIELGEKELKSKTFTIFRRDVKTKTVIESKDILRFVTSLLNKEIPDMLSQKVSEFYDSKIKHFDKVDSALEWIKDDGVAKINWCEEKACYDSLASLEQGIESTGTLEDESSPGQCLICGKKTRKLTLLGRGY